MTDRADIPGIETIKIKRRIAIQAIRCIACGIWECPTYDKDRYEAEIMGETIGLCESCRKAIKWAKEQMEKVTYNKRSDIYAEPKGTGASLDMAQE